MVFMLAVSTLWMPMMAFCVLTTLGPIWKWAPPPVIVKLIVDGVGVAVVGALTVMLMARAGVSIDNVLPSPVAKRH